VRQAQEYTGGEVDQEGLGGSRPAYFMVLRDPTGHCGHALEEYMETNISSIEE